MAATKVWKKLRRVEKIGLMALCVLMLLTLGIGGGTVFESCGESAGAGSLKIDGEELEVGRAAYDEFVQGYWALDRIYADRLGREPSKLDDDALQQQYLLYRLAKRNGITVPDDALREYIQSRMFVDMQTGSFDRDLYEAMLEKHRITTRTFEKALRQNLEVAEYMSLFENSVDPTMEEVYARFRERNKKYHVEYTWLSLEPYEEQVDAEEFTDEEIQDYYDTISYRHTVPLRRKLEAAYVILSDIPDATFQTKYEEWVTRRPELKVSYGDGWMYWRRNRGMFDEAARAALRGESEKPDEEDEEGTPPPDDDGAGESKEGEESPTPPPGEDDGDGAMQDEDPAPGDGPEPAGEGGIEGEVRPGEVPAAPDTVEGEVPAPEAGGTAEEEPEAIPELTDRQKYETHWETIIRKELFYRRLAQLLHDEASDSETPLKELVAKYDGFHHVETDLLEDGEIAEIPEIGYGGLRDQVTKYDDPERYGGHLLSRILPTTDSSAEPRRRGWQIVRIVAIDKSHPAPLEDVIDEVREEYRTKKIRDLGTEELKKLREAAKEDGADFETLVKERDLEIRKLHPFDGRTVPPAPDREELESEDADVRARAERLSRDGVVMTRGLRNLRGLRNEDFTLPLIDERSNCAILVHLLGRVDPGPEEMTDRDIRTIRRELWGTARNMMRAGRFSAESLRERLQFELPERR